MTPDGPTDHLATPDSRKKLVTVTSWEELCRIIRTARDDGKGLILKPVRWYGEMEKDRKTKELKSVVGDNVVNITFEVTEFDRKTSDHLRGLIEGADEKRD